MDIPIDKPLVLVTWLDAKDGSTGWHSIEDIQKERLAMCHSVGWLMLKDEKKTLPCAAYLNGEYGVKNMYAGVPVIIGRNGIEKVVELPLSQNEKINFDLSIKAVKDLLAEAQKIDSGLKN